MDPMRSRLQVFLLALLLVMVMGILGFMFVEGLSFGDALYFSIVTVSTVGYGDVHPVTPLGKLFAALLIIGGTGSFLGIIAAVSEMLLNRREKVVRLQKINMIKSAFFSDVGAELLKILSDSDPNLNEIKEMFNVEGLWTDKDFNRLDRDLLGFNYSIDIKKVDLGGLKVFLVDKKNFLLRLLENPYLLEHESFSELLRAVFHLYDEFMARKTFENLPKSDLDHLGVDARKVYSQLAIQWIEHMKYLKASYPYLFYFGMKMNPFSERAAPFVK
jgi:hypothetical protein